MLLAFPVLKNTKTSYKYETWYANLSHHWYENKGRRINNTQEEFKDSNSSSRPFPKASETWYARTREENIKNGSEDQRKHGVSLMQQTPTGKKSLVRKLKKHFNITQVAINGIVYILENKYPNIQKLAKSLDESIELNKKKTVNDQIKNSIGHLFNDALAFSDTKKT